MSAAGWFTRATRGSNRHVRRFVYRRVYLRSTWWRKRREGALQRAGYRCERCGRGRGPLDVHHLTYRHIGAERKEELMVLCRRCDKREGRR